MDYEQFSQNVTATAAAKRAVDEFAKKQVDGLHICPRCGRLTVKERLTTNALSRHADVSIWNTPRLRRRASATPAATTRRFGR